MLRHLGAFTKRLIVAQIKEALRTRKKTGCRIKGKKRGWTHRRLNHDMEDIVRSGTVRFYLKREKSRHDVTVVVHVLHRFAKRAHIRPLPLGVALKNRTSVAVESRCCAPTKYPTSKRKFLFTGKQPIAKTNISGRQISPALPANGHEKS